jgi:tetratricopeptide (TPR) repeat protein
MKRTVFRIECRYSTSIRYLIVLFLGLVAVAPHAAAVERQRSLSEKEQRLVHEAQQILAKKQYGKAQQILSAYLEKHPEGVHYLVPFTLGNALAMGGDAPAALDHYKTAAAIHPNDHAIWQNMGKLYYDLQQYDEAGLSLARAHELEKPPAPSTAYQAAVAFIMAEKPAKARTLLEPLVKKTGSTPEPEWVDALLKVYLDLGMDGKALNLTGDLLGKTGHRPHTWQILAHLYMKRKAYGKAAAALEIYAALTPMDEEKTRLLGDLYRMAGVPLKAAQTYENLLSVNGSAAIYEKSAAAYLAAFRKDKAVEVLRRGIKLKATPNMWWALGSIHYEAGRYDHAYQAFEQCARFDSKNAKAQLMMGYCALQMDRLSTAEAAFSQAARHQRQRGEAQKRLQEIKKMRIALKKEVGKESVQ